MTPKQKCDELVTNCSKYVSSWENAKQCALICVDNIINALNSDIIIYGSEYRYEADNYWEGVKSEIENL